jgi:hypothetical protein
MTLQQAKQRVAEEGSLNGKDWLRTYEVMVTGLDFLYQAI